MATRTEKYRREKFSQDALRQQQMAWNLYMAVGRAEALRTVIRTNSFCLLRADVSAMKSELRHAEQSVKFWREQLKTMNGEE